MELMSETTTTTGAETQAESGEQETQTFTQADVDKIVKTRAERLAKQLYPDYDDLKAKAEGATTVEQKLAALETKHAEAEARVRRSEIAAAHGISTKKGPNGEPSDADLFLTGSDEATLTAQAERLAQRVVDQKKNGNVARKEGETKTTGKDDTVMREFARTLFDRAD